MVYEIIILFLHTNFILLSTLFLSCVGLRWTFVTFFGFNPFVCIVSSPTDGGKCKHAVNGIRKPVLCDAMGPLCTIHGIESWQLQQRFADTEAVTPGVCRHRGVQGGFDKRSVFECSTTTIKGRAASRNNYSPQLVFSLTNSFVVSLRCRLTDLLGFHACRKGY